MLQKKTNLNNLLFFPILVNHIGYFYRDKNKIFEIHQVKSVQNILPLTYLQFFDRNYQSRVHHT